RHDERVCATMRGGTPPPRRQWGTGDDAGLWAGAGRPTVRRGYQPGAAAGDPPLPGPVRGAVGLAAPGAARQRGSPVLIIRTFGLMLLAATCEVGGAYLIWQWRRAGQPVVFALLGVAALAAYAWLQTAQAFTFGRAFAAYGGIFILLALLWGWGVDGQAPD